MYIKREIFTKILTLPLTAINRILLLLINSAEDSEYTLCKDTRLKVGCSKFSLHAALNNLQEVGHIKQVKHGVYKSVSFTVLERAPCNFKYASAIMNADLPAREKMQLLAITKYISKKENYCWPNKRTIMGITGYDPRTAERINKKLINKNILSRKVVRGKWCYCVNLNVIYSLKIKPIIKEEATPKQIQTIWKKIIEEQEKGNIISAKEAQKLVMKEENSCQNNTFQSTKPLFSKYEKCTPQSLKFAEKEGTEFETAVPQSLKFAEKEGTEFETAVPQSLKLTPLNNKDINNTINNKKEQTANANQPSSSLLKKETEIKVFKKKIEIIVIENITSTPAKEKREGETMKVEEVLKKVQNKNIKVKKNSLDLVQVWKKLFPVLGEVSSLQETYLKSKEMGQLKQIYKIWGSNQKEKLEYIMLSWTDAAIFITGAAGLGKVPSIPHIGFILKHALIFDLYYQGIQSYTPQSKNAVKSPLQEPEGDFNVLSDTDIEEKLLKAGVL